jgi:serine/threonine protein kinase
MAPTDDGDRETRVWQRARNVYGDTIAPNPRSTMVPGPASDSASRGAAAVLDRLYGRDTALTGVSGEPGETRARLDTAYELGETIGLGGMGVVREAEQVALGRKVALKSLRADRRSAATTLELLREAWIAGSLDHPNVVPVHDIVLDLEHDPVIVLKRIDGVGWGELMHEAERVRAHFGADDLLEWNLSILMQVLNAVRFAHSRGILHRDIKPDNVMIGDFGEVYVVDWGLAVSLVADDTGRLPLAANAIEMAGTPCYLAPEMLGDGGPGLSPRTDIYLAGATLYEIISGQPPHTGKDLLTIIKSVLASTPELPEHAPEELFAICRQAMAAEPDERFVSVDDMLSALRGFSRHRGSARLAERADATLEELMRGLRPDAGQDAGHGQPSEGAVRADDAQRQRLYKLFGACRFGFHEALAAWPENRAARAGMTRAVLAMIDYELDSGQPRTAAALYADLAEPMAEVRARIDAAVHAEQAERDRFAQLAERGREFDTSVRERERIMAATTMVVVFTLVPLLLIWRYGTTTYDSHAELMIWNAGYLCVTASVGLVFRRGLVESAINRRLYFTVILLLASNTALQLGLWQAGFSAEQSLLVHVFLWFFTTASVSVTVDRRLFPAACSYLLGFLALALDSDMNMYVVTVPHGLLAVNLAAIWTPARRLSVDSGVR